MAKFCTNCGNELEENATMCVKCGKMVNENINRNTSNGNTKKRGLPAWAIVLIVVGCVILVPIIICVVLAIVGINYIKDNDINEYIGYVNYQYNKNDKRYECGILIEAKYRGYGYAVPALKLLCEEAKKNKISELYDSFEMTRKNTLEVFLSAGFSIVSYQKWLKNTAMVDGVVVKITL